MTEGTSAERAVCRVAPGPLLCVLCHCRAKGGLPCGRLCGATLHRSLHSLPPPHQSHPPAPKSQSTRTLTPTQRGRCPPVARLRGPQLTPATGSSSLVLGSRETKDWDPVLTSQRLPQHQSLQAGPGSSDPVPWPRKMYSNHQRNTALGSFLFKKKKKEGSKKHS